MKGFRSILFRTPRLAAARSAETKSGQSWMATPLIQLYEDSIHWSPVLLLTCALSSWRMAWLAQRCRAQSWEEDPGADA